MMARQPTSRLHLSAWLVAVSSAALLTMAGCPSESSQGDRHATARVALDDPLDQPLLSAAESCRDCVVLHRVHVALPLAGEQFERAKLFDVSTGASYDLAVRADGTVIDPEYLISVDEDALRARNGTFHPAVVERFRSLSPGDTEEVWVWLKTVEEPQDREAIASDAVTRDAVLGAHHGLLRDVTEPLVEDLERVGLAATALADAPVVAVRGRLADLDPLRTDPRVAAVYVAPGLGTPTCRTYVQSVQADLAHAAGWTGQNQRVSEKEGNQPDDYSLLSVVDIASPTGDTLPHATAVLGIMRTRTSMEHG